MKIIILVFFGFLLLATGIILHVNAAKWSMVIIAREPNATVSQSNNSVEETYAYTHLLQFRGYLRMFNSVEGMSKFKM